MKTMNGRRSSGSVLTVLLTILICVQAYAEDNMTVRITAPESGSKWSPCININLTAEATIQTGTIKNVKFYKREGLQFIGQATKVPYTFVMKEAQPGFYDIIAKVTDDANNTAFSETIYFTVGENEDGNMLFNGDFECSGKPWVMGLTGTARATVVYDSMAELYSGQAMMMTIQDGGELSWYIQYYQNFPIYAGHTYFVSFWAVAMEPKAISVNFQENGGDWTVPWQQDLEVYDPALYGPFEFQCMEDDITAQFKFILGANTTEIWLDHVVIVDNLANAVPAGEAGVSRTFHLLGNHPNPFNSSTAIRYRMPAPGNVVLDIFDIQGRKIRTLSEAFNQAGTHQVFWDGTDAFSLPVPSGTYLFNVKASAGGKSWSENGKMLLVK
ncbi:carbohydrate binding domain-containing protein [bacterium]|nr:carbohydrate binding domain-containing protein [bacterium]